MNFHQLSKSYLFLFVCCFESFIIKNTQSNCIKESHFMARSCDFNFSKIDFFSFSFSPKTICFYWLFSIPISSCVFFMVFGVNSYYADTRSIVTKKKEIILMSVNHTLRGHLLKKFKEKKHNFHNRTKYKRDVSRRVEKKKQINQHNK